MSSFDDLDREHRDAAIRRMKAELDAEPEVDMVLELVNVGLHYGEQMRSGSAEPDLRSWLRLKRVMNRLNPDIPLPDDPRELTSPIVQRVNGEIE